MKEGFSEPEVEQLEWIPFSPASFLAEFLHLSSPVTEAHRGAGSRGGVGWRLGAP